MSNDLYMKAAVAKTISGFIKALNILAKYEKDGLNERFFCEAEHDVLYSRVSIEALKPDSEDGKELSRLGWHPDKDIDVWAYFT